MFYRFKATFDFWLLLLLLSAASRLSGKIWAFYLVSSVFYPPAVRESLKHKQMKIFIFYLVHLTVNVTKNSSKATNTHSVSH